MQVFGDIPMRSGKPLDHLVLWRLRKEEPRGQMSVLVTCRHSASPSGCPLHPLKADIAAFANEGSYGPQDDVGRGGSLSGSMEPEIFKDRQAAQRRYAPFIPVGIRTCFAEKQTSRRSPRMSAAVIHATKVRIRVAISGHVAAGCPEHRCC